MKVPRVESKLRVFAFKITFSSQVNCRALFSLYDFAWYILHSILVLELDQVNDLRLHLNTINGAAREVSWESVVIKLVHMSILLASIWFHKYVQVKESAKLRQIMQTILLWEMPWIKALLEVPLSNACFNSSYDSVAIIFLGIYIITITFLSLNV